MLDIFATAMEKLDELWNVMVRGAWFTGPAAFFAAVADWFGWPYGGTALVAGLVTMDWILGLSRAAATHTLSGSRFKAGILKWCVWLVVFAMAAGVRRSFPDAEPAKWLANFMIINVAIVELVSVLRNGLALSIALNVKINGLDFVLERIESIRRMKKEIGKVTNDGEHVLSIEGPLDISPASEMKDQAYRILEQHRRISFDFHAVKFVDSEGLSVLVGTANHAGAIEDADSIKSGGQLATRLLSNQFRR